MNTENPTIEFLRLNPKSDKDIPLPRYMTHHSSGMDICAAIEDNLALDPGAIALIPTGFAVSIPEGFEAQIRPRSGLAIKHGISIINSPGTIDADYRGEVKIALINMGDVPYTIRRGDRIAQMVIKRVYHATLKIVEKLSETGRNTGGFGHTGVS
ncbi:MAG: dUTP diphosphatase [Deltaproteobacteria bacterium]|nr:dUTP diphosphatase [Deltaproteobacteria bacterium]